MAQLYRLKWLAGGLITKVPLSVEAAKEMGMGLIKTKGGEMLSKLSGTAGSSIPMCVDASLLAPMCRGTVGNILSTRPTTANRLVYTSVSKGHPKGDGNIELSPTALQFKELWPTSNATLQFKELWPTSNATLQFKELGMDVVE